MAKTITPAFSIATFFGAAEQNVLAYATHDATVEAIQPLLANASLQDCAAVYWNAANVADTSRAGTAGALIRTREMLEAEGIEIEKDAVTEALRLPLWQAAGFASVQKLIQPKALEEGANAKAVAAHEKAVAAYEALKPAYNRINKRLERWVLSIVGIEAAAVSVPRALQALIDQALAYEGAQIKRALEIGRDKMKRAKAKAAKAAK